MHESESNNPRHPAQDLYQVEPHSTQDDVDPVAFASTQVAPIQRPLVFHMADDRLDAVAPVLGLGVLARQIECLIEAAIQCLAALAVGLLADHIIQQSSQTEFCTYRDMFPFLESGTLLHGKPATKFLITTGGKPVPTNLVPPVPHQVPPESSPLINPLAAIHFSGWLKPDMG